MIAADLSDDFVNLVRGRLTLQQRRLDYFNTRKAMAAINHSVLDERIQRAALVTIARESGCVRSCQLQGEGLDSDFLEYGLLAHLSRAVGAQGSTIVVQRHP